MDAIHLMAQNHFDENRFHLSYIFALRAAQIPRPPQLDVAQNVLLRDTNYLYDYEGERLLGFASEKVGEYGQCIISLRKVMKKRPDDEIALRLLRVCEQKMNVLGKIKLFVWFY